MTINSDNKNLISKVLLTALTAIVSFGAQPALAQANFKSYKVVVNSDRDTVNADRELTLREAISIVNNTLSWEDLSKSEQRQITVVKSPQASRIEFALPAPAKIELTDVLPPLVSPGLVVDGTSHPNYDANESATAEIPIPIPVVSLTATEGVDVFRGLTISGDRITVKGLSIYGFNQPSTPTDTTPGADIVISSGLPRANEELPVAENPPQDVAIIDSWLGLPPDGSLREIPSSFGVWLFDGVNTKIKRNRIYHHGGSGILTSVEASKTQIRENIIVGNGLTGMPHAIYLEGQINDSQIVDNLLCGNDGSGVYLFKPDGKLTVNNNIIKFNGRRVPSAGVYLIGNDHQVKNNEISWQTGTGVTIAAYPQSDRNIIENNSFSDLEGLSIDLNTRHKTNNPLWKLGDGVNPVRNSRNRRRDTANRAINAPQFFSEEFYLIDGKVHIDGVADPDAKISLYRVDLGIPRTEKKQAPLASQSKNYGPLSKHLSEVVADSEGKFSFSLDNLREGTVISAIATKSADGTSEPALNATIKSLEASQPTIERFLTAEGGEPVTLPNCTTKPVAEVSEPPVKSEVVEIPPVRRTIILNVPRNVHFGLDKSNISRKSAEVLDKVAAVLAKHPFITIELQGHTDLRGNVQYNMALSRRRANATRNYLLKQGVPAERMTIRSLGKSQLKKTGTSIVEHAYNRRVEILFGDTRGLDIIFKEQDTDLQLESNKEN